MITDVLHHRTDPVDVVRKPTPFHVIAKGIAEYSSEIFMPWKRQEASAVCEHPDETAQQPHVRQDVKLFFYSILLV